MKARSTSASRLSTLIGLGDIVQKLWGFPEQQEIVRRVEGLFALADQLAVRLAKARGQVDQLTPALLARACVGQLVPQDPSDEPVEKLLERIKESPPGRLPVRVPR